MINKLKLLNQILLLFLLTSLTSCNGQTKRETFIETNPNKPIALTGESRISLPKDVDAQVMFRCSFKDKEGNIWFGTTGAGIYKWDGKLFTRFAENEGLKNVIIYCITQSQKGQIWIATNNGIYFSDGVQFNQLQIPIFENTVNLTFELRKSNTEKLQTYSVLGDSKGNVWIGTENKGLWCFDGKNFKNYVTRDKIWIENTKENPSLNDKKGVLIQSLFEDSKGNIWISAVGAPLNYYDGKAFHSLYDELDKTTSKGIDNIIMTSGHIFQILEDKNGNIWMATRNNGICRYNGKTIEQFSAKDGVTDNGAICIYEDNKGNIWFGSQGIAGSGGSGNRGLTMYNGTTFTAVSTKEMRNNQVWTLVGDNSQNIWIGTKEFGLYRYDGKQFTEMTQK